MLLRKHKIQYRTYSIHTVDRLYGVLVCTVDAMQIIALHSLPIRWCKRRFVQVLALPEIARTASQHAVLPRL